MAGGAPTLVACDIILCQVVTVVSVLLARPHDDIGTLTLEKDAREGQPA